MSNGQEMWKHQQRRSGVEDIVWLSAVLEAIPQ